MRAILTRTCKYFLFGLFFVSLGIQNQADAQIMGRPSNAEIPQQSVYLELGGNALIYSFNYDVLFRNNWGVRLGASYTWDANDTQVGFGDYRFQNSTAFFGLVMGQRMFGKGDHKLETGAGILFGTIYDTDDWDSIEPPGATFTIGYRYYPDVENRFTFKIAFTPVINHSGIHPRVGVSFGITLTPEGDADIR